MTRAARAYVADVQRKTTPKRHAFTVHVNRQIAGAADQRRQAALDAAAYDAMTKSTAEGGARPLKPPALPANMPTVRSVGARGLEPVRLRAEAMHWTGEGWRS